MTASDFFDRLLCLWASKNGPAKQGAVTEEGGVMKRFLTALQVGLPLCAAAFASGGTARGFRNGRRYFRDFQSGSPSGRSRPSSSESLRFTQSVNWTGGGSSLGRLKGH